MLSGVGVSKNVEDNAVVIGGLNDGEPVEAILIYKLRLHGY